MSRIDVLPLDAANRPEKVRMPLRQRRGKMFALPALAVLGFVFPAHSQRPQVRLTTFTDPDGAFQFSYPSDWGVCTRHNVQQCNPSMIPLCDETARICVAIPESRLKETTFQGAAFEVRKVLTEREGVSADECVTPAVESGQTEYMISAKQPAKLIGGNLFVHGVKGDAAMSHGSSVDVYRIRHSGECFELSVGHAGVNGQVFDPPRKGLTPRQQKRVDTTLNQILESFRFTK